MSQNLAVRNNLAEREQISSIIEKTLSENISGTTELKRRWENGFNSIFSSLSSSVSRFFVSFIKNEEIAQLQAAIRHIFRKTDYIEKIRNDFNLQNAF